jgi:hypothetical protein
VAGEMQQNNKRRRHKDTRVQKVVLNGPPLIDFASALQCGGARPIVTGWKSHESPRLRRMHTLRAGTFTEQDRRTAKPCQVEGVGLDCEPDILSSYAPDKVPASRHVSASSLVALLLGSCDGLLFVRVLYIKSGHVGDVNRGSDSRSIWRASNPSTRCPVPIRRRLRRLIAPISSSSNSMRSVSQPVSLGSDPEPYPHRHPADP